jgi:putative ABC transport system permease protein
MPLREIIRLSLGALYAHPLRTALTMLGMIIGVASIILLVSIGDGARRFILGQFEELGTNLIIVQPGKTDKKSRFGPPVGAAQRKMTLADVTALERGSFNIEATTGLVFGSATVRYGEWASNVSVFGANEQFPRILTLGVEQGRFFEREEDAYGRRVTVLGAGVARYLFGEETPLGAQVKINASRYRVIGVLRATGDKLGFNLDDFVFIPTRAALRTFNEDKLFGIRAKARSRGSVDDAVEEIRSILAERRNGEEDFTIITQDSILATMGSILSMLTYVLGAIAAVSMVVAGIGIMNITLVAVAERTPEIGIRRAVGARRRDILQQFLAEAAMLSSLGGVLGVLFALLITTIASALLPTFDVQPPLWVLPLGLLLSVGVGVIFGVWPAHLASRVEPLEALRYE